MSFNQASLEDKIRKVTAALPISYVQHTEDFVLFKVYGLQHFSIQEIQFLKDVGLPAMQLTGSTLLCENKPSDEELLERLLTIHRSKQN